MGAEPQSGLLSFAFSCAVAGQKRTVSVKILKIFKLV